MLLCTLVCTYYDIPERSERYVDAFHLQKDLIVKNGTCVVFYTRTCALFRRCESVLLFLFVVFGQAVLLKYLEHIKTTESKVGENGATCYTFFFSVFLLRHYSMY